MNTMYKTPKFSKGTLMVNQSTEGETIEKKIERILNNKEPIKDGAPLIFTERNQGIGAAYNPRTDRFEIAVEASEKVAKSYKARRDEKGTKAKKSAETESTQGKGEPTTEPTK